MHGRKNIKFKTAVYFMNHRKHVNMMCVCVRACGARAPAKCEVVKAKGTHTVHKRGLRWASAK